MLEHARAVRRALKPPRDYKRIELADELLRLLEIDLETVDDTIEKNRRNGRRA